MADVTVRQLAEVVGAPVDRLLKQMHEAGLSQTGVDDLVSDEEKQKLLSHLRAQPWRERWRDREKITLQRKRGQHAQAGDRTGGEGKTINVEVRKKKVYARRDAAEETQPVPSAPPPVAQHEVVPPAPAEERSARERIAEEVQRKKQGRGAFAADRRVSAA